VICVLGAQHREKDSENKGHKKGGNQKRCMKVNSCSFFGHISELYPIFCVGSMGEAQGLRAAGAPNMRQTVKTR